MSVADDLLENTHRGLARLLSLVGSLSERSLAATSPSGWNVVTTLAHLAFYDDWVAERWRRWLATETFQDLPDDITDLANTAGSRGWEAVAPHLARALASQAAQELTGLLVRLPRAALDDAVVTCRLAMIDRSLHWGPHLDEIEATWRDRDGTEDATGPLPG